MQALKRLKQNIKLKTKNYICGNTIFKKEIKKKFKIAVTSGVGERQDFGVTEVLLTGSSLTVFVLT